MPTTAVISRLALSTERSPLSFLYTELCFWRVKLLPLLAIVNELRYISASWISSFCYDLIPGWGSEYSLEGVGQVQVGTWLQLIVVLP